MLSYQDHPRSHWAPKLTNSFEVVVHHLPPHMQSQMTITNRFHGVTLDHDPGSAQHLTTLQSPIHLQTPSHSSPITNESIAKMISDALSQHQFTPLAPPLVDDEADEWESFPMEAPFEDHYYAEEQTPCASYDPMEYDPMEYYPHGFPPTAPPYIPSPIITPVQAADIYANPVPSTSKTPGPVVNLTPTVPTAQVTAIVPPPVKTPTTTLYEFPTSVKVGQLFAEYEGSFFPLSGIDAPITVVTLPNGKQGFKPIRLDLQGVKTLVNASFIAVTPPPKPDSRQFSFDQIRSPLHRQLEEYTGWIPSTTANNTIVVSKLSSAASTIQDRISSQSKIALPSPPPCYHIDSTLPIFAFASAPQLAENCHLLDQAMYGVLAPTTAQARQTDFKARQRLLSVLKIHEAA